MAPSVLVGMPCESRGRDPTSAASPMKSLRVAESLTEFTRCAGTAVEDYRPPQGETQAARGDHEHPCQRRSAGGKSINATASREGAGSWQSACISAQAE